MRAVILAAGRGTRLRPLTDDRPKCLVELFGVSLLERQLRVLSGAGIEDVTVVAGYQAEAVRATGARVVLNPGYETNNMVASLFCASELLTDASDLIVGYGDIVYESGVLDAVLEVDAPVVLAVDEGWESYWKRRMPDPLADAETLRLSAEGRVRSLGQKPGSLDEIQGQYIGLFKVRADRVPKLLDVYRSLDREARYDGQGFDEMYMTSFLQVLIDRGWAVQAAPIQHGWLELDSVDDLRLYEQIHAEGTLGSFCKL